MDFELPGVVCETLLSNVVFCCLMLPNVILCCTVFSGVFGGFGGWIIVYIGQQGTTGATECNRTTVVLQSCKICLYPSLTYLNIFAPLVDFPSNRVTLLSEGIPNPICWFDPLNQQVKFLLLLFYLFFGSVLLLLNFILIYQRSNNILWIW